MWQLWGRKFAERSKATLRRHQHVDLSSLQGLFPAVLHTHTHTHPRTCAPHAYTHHMRVLTPSFPDSLCGNVILIFCLIVANAISPPRGSLQHCFTREMLCRPAIRNSHPLSLVMNGMMTLSTTTSMRMQCSHIVLTKNCIGTSTEL